jgi:hypothetical protein
MKTVHTCEICGYSTSIKCNFIKHQNRKKNCKSKVNYDNYGITPELNTQKDKLNLCLEQVESNQKEKERTSGKNSKIITQKNRNDINNTQYQEPINVNSNGIGKNTEFNTQKNKPILFSKQVQSNPKAYETTSGTNSEINTQKNKKKINVFSCVRCKKILHSKQSLQKHENICNGLNSLQCPTCEKWFSCRHSKYIHKKKSKCVPKKLLYDVHNEKTTNNAESSGVNKMSNTLSQNNIVCETITNNINNTSNTQHIHINVFGSEDIKYLSQDENLMQRLTKYSRKGVYALPEIIKEIHCSNKNLENNTILKPLQYGQDVFIMGDEEQWELREFSDIRETLIESISKYLKIYNNIKNKLEVKLNDKKEQRRIQHLCYYMLSIDGDIPLDLIDELEINDEILENRYEKEKKDSIRKFDKATMNILHNYTIENYKKDKSKFMKT